MTLPPHIAKAAPPTPELRDRVDRYARDRNRLLALMGNIESDRLANRYRTGGWFSGPPAPIATEAREIEALRLAGELESEYSAITQVCPIASSLDAPLSIPKGTES